MGELRPRAGVHYPGSAGEFRSWFRTDEDCLDYLEWLRWPEGFVCPRCGHAGGWLVADGRYKCAGCGGRTSVTAGTLFDRRRTPLTVWFEACWSFASGKDGMSALSLQRSLEIGSYVTAWAMLHRLRSVLVRPGRDRLTGTVEVDETYIGGEEPGLRGGRAKGKKVLVGVAVEVTEPRGFGRARMQILADGSAASLHSFVTAHVEPGARVITDGWAGYRGIDKLGYTYEPRSQRAARARGEDPGELLPGVHRIASLVKRWLLGTHQGSVEEVTLRAWIGRVRTAHGAGPPAHKSGQLNSPEQTNGMAGMPEIDIARVQRWCRSRVPVQVRAEVRVEADVNERNVTIMECHPPWQAADDAAWTRFPVARLRYTRSTRQWSLYWRDRHSRFHEYDRVPATGSVEELLEEIDRDPTAIFWG